LRLGAESVMILYRRTHAEMPAYHEEVEEAEREGVVIKCLTAPMEIQVSEGRVTGVVCRPMVLKDFDRTGRRRPVAEENKNFVVPADQVIAAIGQTLKLDSIISGFQIIQQADKFIHVNPTTMQSSEPWIFAGGDAVTGPFSVVEAVASGEKAAVGIDAFLTGSTHAFWREDKKVDTFFDADADPVTTPRAEMRLIPVEKRRNNFTEVELPFLESTALKESKRCLRCDYRSEG
jgi:NADH-quinone oxidoreductase subunit F